MAGTPARVEAIIVVKEVELIRKYETHRGQPLGSCPFWTIRILLAWDIQAKLQLMQGIHESLSMIREGKQESAAGFRMLE